MIGVYLYFMEGHNVKPKWNAGFSADKEWIGGTCTSYVWIERGSIARPASQRPGAFTLDQRASFY